MRLQSLVFLVLLAIICEHQCSAQSQPNAASTKDKVNLVQTSAKGQSQSGSSLAQHKPNSSALLLEKGVLQQGKVSTTSNVNPSGLSEKGVSQQGKVSTTSNVNPSGLSEKGVSQQGKVSTTSNVKPGGLSEKGVSQKGKVSTTSNVKPGGLSEKGVSQQGKFSGKSESGNYGTDGTEIYGRNYTYSSGGWDFQSNYQLDDSEYSYDKASYNQGDDDSYAQKTYYNNDDDDSYAQQSYYNNDDDEYNEDYKPSEYRSTRRRKSPDELGYMNIYFREPSKDGKRKRPKRIGFPTGRYERNRYPLSGSLISFLPWLPIFADRLTKQTIIFSPTGGIYILPPVINFYGRMFSVAELIASGYASLVSTGAPPPPAVDVAPLVKSGAIVGPGVPTINTATGGFSGGVRTEFRSFTRPRYPKVFEVAGPDYQKIERSAQSGYGY